MSHADTWQFLGGGGGGGGGGEFHPEQTFQQTVVCQVIFFHVMP